MSAIHLGTGEVNPLSAAEVEVGCTVDVVYERYDVNICCCEM